MDDDKRDAYDTLYTVLVTLREDGRAAAAVRVARRSTAASPAKTSVHLADWPDAATLPADASSSREMDRVRDVCSAALTLREKRERARAPAAAPSMTIAGAGRRGARALRRRCCATR